MFQDVNIWYGCVCIILVCSCAQVSILEELAPFERFKIAEAMEMRTYNDGEIIIAEGDPGLFQKSERHF